ncbi:MAG: class I SAM-dependent methyltransferase [Chitinophagaceae bacterium]
MKEFIKNFLRKAGLYYGIQGRYRSGLFYLSILSTRKRYIKYKGAGFTCNFCNKKYQKFVPRYSKKEDKVALEKYHVIGGDGENVYCPYCRSTSRERLILQMLKIEIDYRNKKILHLSPEKKIFDFLKQNANVITADIEPGFYKLIDKNVKYADATSLPFEKEIFDIIIANHVMEHIAEDSLAMKEIYRVLKSNGRAILQIPFSNSIPETIEEPFICDEKKQSELFGQKDHVRIYNINDYMNRLRKAGFKVKYISPEMLEKWKEYALQPCEGFIDCRKE